MRVNFLILLMSLGLAVPGRAGNDSDGTPGGGREYPVPQLTDKLLFYVQRTHNRNTVIYELNFMADGMVDARNPLHPVWIRYEEGGVRKELSFIQNRVYGLDIRILDKDTWLVRFRAYKKRDIYLVRHGKSNKFRVMVKINGKMAELTNLFISSINNALGIPSTVRYIDISGVDPVTRDHVTERVIP